MAIPDVTQNTQSFITLAGSGDRYVHADSSGAIFAAEPVVDRVEFIVADESEFINAYTTINSIYSGGVIRLGADITFTQDHSFSHEGITIECDYSRMYFNGHTLTVVGNSCYYNNGFFDAVSSGAKFIFSAGVVSTNYLFYNCRFYRFLTTASAVVFDTRVIGGSSHLILKNCNFNSNVSINSYDAQLTIASGVSYASFQIYGDTSEDASTNTKRFGVIGTLPSSGYKEFSDGSCTFNNGITATAIVNILEPIISKTTPVDADSLVIKDSTTSLFNKLTWSNLKNTLKTYFDTLYVLLLTSIVSITGTSSLISSHNKKVLEFDSSSAFTFTIDQMSAGFTADLVNINTGDVTLAAGSGVTLRNVSANRKLTTQWQACSIYFRSATECVIIGTLDA